MRTLFVAAGGGGDAVGILLSRRVIDPKGEGPTLISTCAWERLRIDPLPGPRPIEGFTGLAEVDGSAIEVLPSSDTAPPGRSMLPRLAGHGAARIFLHDFAGGAQGLANQLFHTATAVQAELVVVVDVGGDVVAMGDEPNLLSPLADSLTLAAVIASGLPTRLVVVGPGVDAELSADEVIGRLGELGATVAGQVSSEDVEPHKAVLDWHPTEASALVAASASGIRGSVEMRRGHAPVPLTQQGREVWVIDGPRLHDFPLARQLFASTSLGEAIETIEALAVNEIAYERAKAKELHRLSRRSSLSLKEVAGQGLARGATHITTRRLVEQSLLPPFSDPRTVSQLRPNARRVGGLWDLVSLARDPD